MAKIQNPNQTKKYNLDYTIGFSALNPGHFISLPAFMNIVQETSLMHTYQTPQSLKYYDELDLAWVITHWQVEIDYLPKVAERVNIATWPVGFRSFFGERSFEAKSEQGESILRANSNWILLNRSTLKPHRPNEIIAQQYGTCYPFVVEKNFSMPKISDFELISEHNYTVLRRDIDTNRHVNNANYLYWLYNYLPNDLYKNFLPKLLKVAYKKEMLLGDNALIQIYRKENNIFAIIKNNDTITTEIYLEHKE